jgi:hypothetical protein
MRRNLLPYSMHSASAGLRSALLTVLAALGLVEPTPVDARICVMDDVPAATLLLPYFEVDLDNPTGAGTNVSINNAFADPVVAKLELWTDLGVPIFGFNIYLKGYDVQTLNLGDVIRDGILPNTLPPGGTPFASCNSPGILNPPPIFGTQLICHHNAFTGRAVSCLGARCAGVNRGDRIARGYLTVDVVNGCTMAAPVTPGYFSPGGFGTASNRNALWGDYFYTNGGASLAEGETLVHIEADAAAPETSIPGEYTFYGKYVSWTAADNREPLATNFGIRYLNGAGYTSDLIVWRDSKVNQTSFTCPSAGGSYPFWYPLSQERVLVFDEAGNAAAPFVNGLGAVAQRTVVGSPGLPVPTFFGWFFLNLNTTVAGGVTPPEDPAAAQAWVTLVARQAGGSRISVGFNALQYDSACDARHVSAP